MANSFAFVDLCRFVVEGRYCSSSAPAVHTSGTKAVAVGMVGIGPLDSVDYELAALGTNMVGSDTALANTGSITLGPEMSAQTGVGDFSLLSAST